MAKSKKPKAPIGARVRRAFAEWVLGSLTSSDIQEILAYWNGSSSTAGQTVNEQNVLSLSAAWACVRLISESIGTLPLHIYQRTSTGREQAKDHPLYGIIHRKPNADVSANAFWEAMVASMLLQGNGFAEKLMIGKRVVGLDFLVPNRLSITRDVRGNLEYRYTNNAGSQREIPKERIFHIPGFTRDSRWGMSAIQYGAGVFGGALASQAAANNTFENGLMPTVAFSMKNVLKPAQREEFRTYAATVSGALKAGKPVVLENDMTANKVGIDPKDAQLLETRTFNVEEVCRWFRVDPTLVGHGGKDSNWGTGLEQKMLGFLMFTLRVWLVRIAEAINNDLLTVNDRDRFYAEFSIEGLLQADSKARAEFYQVMVDHGIMTRDEIRVKENLPAKGGNAAKLTVNAATVALDALPSQPDQSLMSMLARLERSQKDD